MGGNWRIRAEVVISSGAPGAQSAQSFSTSSLRSQGQASIPACASASGTISNSIAVTTPKLPPPPRSAQNRSGSLSASTRTRFPSALTISTAVIALVWMPCLRPSQPIPPPSE